MPGETSSRILFLDDSGKPSYNDPTSAVVIGGFSVPSERVQELSTRITGAKRRFFPGLGDPAAWEIKARRLLKPKNMRRSKFLRFLSAIARVLSRLGCTTYSVSIDKRRMHREMAIETTMRLQIRALAEHFAAECRFLGATGLLVSDWSNPRLDARISRDIASFVTSNQLPIHPSVYYADSLSSQAIQLADLVAGLRRRAIEAETHVPRVAAEIGSVRSLPADAVIATHGGRRFRTQIELI